MTSIVPKISVVIPTLNRPLLLRRAIDSVLAQTFLDYEIIIVLDGPGATANPVDCETLDPRVRTLVLAKNVGLAEARNEGIRSAHGQWIALLDDDDEWLPQKLELQWQAASQMDGELIFVPCKFLEKTSTIDRIMPDRLPDTASHFSEYIYCEQGYLQPSTYFMSRRLCLAVPFTRGLRHIEDSDWLLRIGQHPGVQIAGVDQVLSIYYNYKDGKRESEGTPWDYPLKWAIAQRHLFTRRAFPYFVARLGLNASRSGEPIGVLFHLLQVASCYGTLTIRPLAYFIAYWFLPDQTLRRLRSAFR